MFAEPLEGLDIATGADIARTDAMQSGLGARRPAQLRKPEAPLLRRAHRGQVRYRCRALERLECGDRRQMRVARARLA